MLDVNSAKVLSAWGVNTALGFFASIAPWIENLGALSKALLLLAQLGVAVATIIYISVKIRNERRK